ncbi:protein LCHN-like [Varroa jacobsoni]|nr:protein LCHN-like [Varroa jacobsoni]XP_022690234.1 protein LCHN-like [Varroa jacobsoni]XP_022690235.1 protein LCHN-like [Varroa jacobsoni]XP_022690236.1 protein LCHN-like [Varroa jacobsoni]XP_022690237.1 protein LCHN-like [Varroa jacobsoni]XP_022690238.1 protein LCHN-like [Varroa jacobsoni]
MFRTSTHGKDKSPLLLDDSVVESVAEQRYDNTSTNDLPAGAAQSSLCGFDSLDPTIICTAAQLSQLSGGKAFATEPEASDELLSDVVGVFVVAFDIRHGNTVEWFTPEELDVNGIEFKAMASGAHRTTDDFIYFKRGSYFGLACFEKLDIASTVERGARMKSVGVLTRSYSLLHVYRSFLQTQVRHLLEEPGSYSDLLHFFQHKRNVIGQRKTDHNSATMYSNKGGYLMAEVDLATFDDGSEKVDRGSYMPAVMEITHPAGCFSQFLNYFGEKVFALWRFALLRKRILFFSQPPIGVVCFRVYCTSTLVAHVHPNVERCSKLCPPQFYVNIADIEGIANLSSYVACTTEKIFESKLSLFDLYIDQQNVRASKLRHHSLLETNVADRLRFSHLSQLRSKAQPPGKESEADESWFTTFFAAQNTQLFKELYAAEASPSRVFTAGHMRRANLDPIADRHFVAELADVYGIDIVLVNDGVCCASLPAS